MVSSHLQTSSTILQRTNKRRGKKTNRMWKDRCKSGLPFILNLESKILKQWNTDKKLSLKQDKETKNMHIQKFSMSHRWEKKMFPSIPFGNTKRSNRRWKLFPIREPECALFLKTLITNKVYPEIGMKTVNNSLKTHMQVGRKKQGEEFHPLKINQSSNKRTSGWSSCKKQRGWKSN